MSQKQMYPYLNEPTLQLMSDSQNLIQTGQQAHHNLDFEKALRCYEEAKQRIETLQFQATSGQYIMTAGEQP